MALYSRIISIRIRKKTEKSYTIKCYKVIILSGKRDYFGIVTLISSVFPLYFEHFPQSIYITLEIH